MLSPIRVAIADDHQSTVDGYVYRLSTEPDITVVGTAFDGQELELLLAKEPADVLLLDVGLPTSPDNANPFPILHVVHDFIQRYPTLAILVISMYTIRTLIDEVVDAGACGYIVKDDRKTIRNLANVVRVVAKEGVYFSGRAFQKWRKRSKQRRRLTPRQTEVLSLCAAYPDLTTAELASYLNISPSTVRNLLSEAYRRLDVRNRTSAIAKGRRLGVITPQLEYQGG